MSDKPENSENAVKCSVLLWRDIETAPLDGSHILLYRPHSIFVGYYGGANSGWHINAPGLPAMWPLPTHWMELPISGYLMSDWTHNDQVIEDKRTEAERRASGSLERIVGRLRKDYEEASKLQLTCQLNSTGWWYCEGRKITAEIALRTIGYEL